MKALARIFRREAGAYFASPVAYLFIGTFLAVTLFVFFWVEAFFARNIADVRPLFEWMPILLIALVAALTMRSWSEERRAGTIEVLMTAGVSSTALVLGKFLAALSLVAVALLLTLPLPITVDALGALDWGPAIGGYVATLFLASAYVALGLFVSSRTDNQIVSLIVTVLISAALYVVGSTWLTSLVPSDVPIDLGRFMRWIGTGSRFDEITRGVLDLRDLYYYLSLVGLFLALNVYSLEKLRWGASGFRRNAGWRAAVVLVAANFLIANVWLLPISAARADITAGNRYTLSEGTKVTLASLREPLVIRGYFSRDTHPLLAPLVPAVRNLLLEYAVIGGEGVNVQFIVPQEQPQAMERARRQYGIEPVPLQTANRYETSVINAWFHLLVRYGDQYKVLDYADLIALKGTPSTGIEATLRNPEYVLTSAIREVAREWRSEGKLFERLQQPVTLHAYVSKPSRLPDVMDAARGALKNALGGLQAEANGKLVVDFQDPAAGDGALATRLYADYGFRAMTTSLGSDEQFYFYLVLEQDGRTVPVVLPEDFTEKDLRAAIMAGLERFGGGLRKTIAVYRKLPQNSRRRGANEYQTLMQRLKATMNVIRSDLSRGRVSADADALLVLAPEGLNATQRFAIDQFLMRGGTVIVAASAYDVWAGRRSGLSVKKVTTGLADWLARYGVSIEEALVLDPRSGKLTVPMPVPGQGYTLRTVPYPYFVAVGEEGLAELPMLGGLHQVTMAWASPLHVDASKAGELTTTTLVHSSPGAWTADSVDLVPDYQRYPENGFADPEHRAAQKLAVMLEGRFTSAFKDKQSPLAEGDSLSAQIAPVIEHSPASARLIVFGSANFLSDPALDIVGSSINSRYVRPVQLVQNVIDASLEDPVLLALRGDNRYTRLLQPLPDQDRMLVETANYAGALGGLVLIFLLQRLWAARRRQHFKRILKQGGAS